MKLYILILINVFSVILYPQARESILIDFGVNNYNYLTPGSWNCITNPVFGTTQLNDDEGRKTGYSLKITNSYTGANLFGLKDTKGLITYIPFTASIDCFYGNTLDDGSLKANPTAEFSVIGLDTTKYYSFSFFSSCNNLIYNTETQFTVKGINEKHGKLNASNNNSQVININYIKPNKNGVISVLQQAGQNNNHPTGNYFLNSLHIISQSDSLLDNSTFYFLKLVNPIGGETYEESNNITIEWMYQGIDSLFIDISVTENEQWKEVVKIPSNTCFYKLKLPETISSNGKIRLRSTSISISNSIPFSIIPKIESKFNIVILGSSTAAGEGASSLYKSWVSLYKKRIEYLDPKIEVINLAVGGFTTFNIIPTGSVIPIDVNQKIDTFRNITAALKYLPKVVIVNLPSNDDTFGYSIDYQKNNYELIYDAAANLKTSIFICSPQPKKFSLGSTNYINHQYMLNWTKDRFREYFIDFWTDFADLNGFLKSDFDSGDLTHFNDAGHEILAQRVFEKRKLFLIDTSLINVESKIDSLNDKFKVFLDKFNLSITMSYFPENDEFVSIDLYNINGSKIDNFFCGKIYSDIGFSRIINHNKYKAGVYFFVLKSNNSKIVKKIIF